MNRNIRRENERIKKRLQNWVSNWNPEQQKLFDQMVENKVDNITKITELILNDCFGIIIHEELKLEVEKVNDILYKADNYIQDAKNFILSEDGERYFKMVNDEKLVNEIKLKAKKMLTSNPKRDTLSIIKELRKTYNLPNKDLHIFTQEVREELKGTNINKPTTEKEEFIQEIGKEIDNKIEVAAEKEFKVTLAMEGEHGSELVVPTIKKVSETFKGNYDTYERSTEGVRTTQRLFKDIKDLNQYKVSVEAEINTQREQLEKEQAEITRKLIEIRENEIKEFNFINEVKQVFEL